MKITDLPLGLVWELGPLMILASWRWPARAQFLIVTYSHLLPLPERQKWILVRHSWCRGHCQWGGGTVSRGPGGTPSILSTMDWLAMSIWRPHVELTFYVFSITYWCLLPWRLGTLALWPWCFGPRWNPQFSFTPKSMWLPGLWYGILPSP